METSADAAIADARKYDLQWGVLFWLLQPRAADAIHCYSGRDEVLCGTTERRRNSVPMHTLPSPKRTHETQA